MSFYQSQPPYKQSPTKYSQSQMGRSRYDEQSPAKQSYGDNEQYMNQIQDLQNQLANAQSDLEIANFKAKKSSELEEKVDMVLKHNAQLLGENDSIQKNYNQKKTESEVWKQKYESQMNAIIQMKANYELEMKKLNGEVSRLKELLDHNSVEKVRGIEETYSKAEIDKRNQIQSLKLSHNNDIQIHQEQIKKLRDIIEQREHEISTLNKKIDEYKSQTNLDHYKLHDDKEKMKMRLSQMEVEHHKQKEFTKQSIDKEYSDTIGNLRKHYEQEMDVLDGEIYKLKGLLNLKSQEIQNLIAHNQELKSNFDEESHMLRIEIQNLKDIIHDNNEQKEKEVHILKERLADHHANDLQGLQFHNDNQIEALNNEIESIKAINNDKQYEIEKQIQEKQQQRDNYHIELERLNKELEEWQYKCHQTERQKEKEQHIAKVELENCQKQAYDYQCKQDDHIKELEKEISVLKSLLESKQRDLEESQANYKKVRANLEDDIKNLNNDYHDLELRGQEMEHQMTIQLRDLEMRFKISENDHVKKHEKHEHTIECQEKESRRLQDTIATKQKEANNLLEHIEQQKEDNAALKKKIDNLQETLHSLEIQKNSEKDKLKRKLEDQHNLVVDNLQQSHSNQVDCLNGIISDHQVKQDYKHNELMQYANKFSKVEDIVRDFIAHPERLKDKAEVNSIMNLYTSLRAKQGRSPMKQSLSPQKYEQN